jgi:DNA-binding Lrp family transcriptional regulator
MAYDDLDEKLVSELIGNGRASMRELADTLDTSVTTISNHLADLEKTGHIEAYTPVVNYDRFGYDVTAIINLKSEGDHLTDLTERLSNIEQFVNVYETTGDYDVIAIGEFEDTDDMNNHVKDLLEDDAVVESNTSVVLNTVNENKQFHLD